jgi:GNAT superfamily N-acetyltransferase
VKDEGRGVAGAAIEPVTRADVERIAALAREIWFEHYPGIISPGQIEYMLAQRYDPAVIADELGRAGLWWDKLTVGGELAGFSSYFLAAEPDALKLDKLYVLARHRRRGHGGMLIARAGEVARREGRRRLVLAVNKRNPHAIAAYRKHGFAVIDAVVKDIGGGYVMDDYVMEKALGA